MKILMDCYMIKRQDENIWGSIYGEKLMVFEIDVICNRKFDGK